MLVAATLNGLQLVPLGIFLIAAICAQEFAVAGWTVALDTPNVLNVIALGSPPDRSWLNAVAALANLPWVGMGASSFLKVWNLDEMVGFILVAGPQTVALLIWVLRLERVAHPALRRLALRLKSTTQD